MSDYTIMRSDDCLAHHGIKGQKWGVRRFENEDGTLTEAGLKRYAKARKIAERQKIDGKQMRKNALKRAKAGAAIGTIAASIADRAAMKKAFDETTDQALTIARTTAEDFGKRTKNVPIVDGRFLEIGFHTDSDGRRRGINAFGFEQPKFKSPGDAIAFGKKMATNLLAAPATGALIGAGVGALGSIAVDSLHNAKINRAKNFLNKYEKAYLKTQINS